MAILEILTIPDSRLKRKSIKVENFDISLKKITKDMFETLYFSGNGIGLAAPQVNIHKRIIVMDLKIDGKNTPEIFINPHITKTSSEKSKHEEGCLSIPDFYAEIKRPSIIDVEWSNLEGNVNKETMTGLKAICMQHEIDHLNGILFIDYLSGLKKKMAINKIKKKKKNDKESSRT